MKKIIGLIVTLIVLLIFSHIIYAAEIVDSGTCGANGDNLTWTLDDRGTLTISGEGEMKNYSNSGAPWIYKDVNRIVIENGVTSIGDYAFDSCSWITEINFNKIETIGSMAFAYCSNLKKITIPNSVKEIKRNAFWWCFNIESVYVEDLSHYLNIEYRSETSNPNQYATKLYINNKRVTSVSIPEDVKRIPVAAFKNCDGLTKVIIPETVIDIDQQAFSGCSSLLDITIPDSVQNIGKEAFNQCAALSNITLGKGLKYIGNEAFYKCNKLTGVYITDMARYLGITFNDATANPLHYGKILYLNNNPVDNLDLSNIIHIPSYAFICCKSLTNLKIPNSVVDIGEHSFDSCSNLKRVTIENNNITDIGTAAFYDCESLQYISIPEGVINIGDLAFASCKNLTHIIIPNSVENIGSQAMKQCTLLETVTISSGLQIINKNIFEGCINLKNVIIPKSVTEIENAAFKDCSSITNVEYGGSVEDWNEIYIGSDNDALINAKINYNSSLAPKPNPTPIPITKAIVTKSESADKWLFNVSVLQTYEDSYVYAALYNNNNEIIEINRVPLNISGDTSIDIAKTSDDKYVKIFVWNDIMQPITESEEIEL